MSNHPIRLIFGRPSLSRQRSAKEGFLVEGAADNKESSDRSYGGSSSGAHRKPESAFYITYLIEGEEEIGSPSFRGVFSRSAEFPRMVTCCWFRIREPGTRSIGRDHPVCAWFGGHGSQSFWPAARFAFRVHGGALLNPLQAIMKICASLHDEHGNVAVPGFYDEVIAPENGSAKN